jgi:hypothetical protein
LESPVKHCDIVDEHERGQIMAALNITESALERLSDAIESVNGSNGADACFRLALDDEDNLALAVDVPSPSDKIYQSQGKTVLVVTDELSERFAGRTLDVNAAGDFVLA